MADAQKRLSIAESLRDLMLREDIDVAWAGEPDLLLQAYIAAGGRVQHPLNRIQAVIGAVRRSKLFVQDDYIRATDSTGTREVLLPAFKLKQSNGL